MSIPLTYCYILQKTPLLTKIEKKDKKLQYFHNCYWKHLLWQQCPYQNKEQTMRSYFASDDEYIIYGSGRGIERKMTGWGSWWEWGTEQSHQIKNQCMQWCIIEMPLFDLFDYSTPGKKHVLDTHMDIYLQKKRLSLS